LVKSAETFDYIIVGAGSAGCVLASRLSTDPKTSVLLLEAGGRDWNPWIHVPVGYFKTMHNPATDWCYLTEPDPGLNGRRLQWPRGRVLGGSSSINGLLYIRGQAQDYDRWRQLGNTGWSYDDVLPYFRKSEDFEYGENDYHGTGGPIAVSGVRIHRKLCDVFIEAAQEVGIPRNDDFSGPVQDGAGYFHQTCRKGRRCSTAVGYLNPVKHRRNLKIVTHALVQKILFDGRRASSVTWTVRGRPYEARCRREIILSAGAIGSPQILMLSGVGPAAHLKDVGIEPVHDLPGVGQNLQDHLQIRSIYKTKEPITLNDEVNNPIRKMLMGMEYLLFRTGPLTIAASQVCVFTKTSPDLEAPDIQFHIQPLSADKPGDGPHRFSAFTASVCQLRPESRGRIELKSSDPAAHPAIFPNYLSTPTDQRIAVEAIKVTRKIANTKALGSLISGEHEPGPDVQTDEELLEYARNRSQTIYHPVGTCKMGTDPMSVVDPRLRLHGLEGLRVVDASIMPNLVSGNTNAPAIMIGEKASDMIREDAQS